MAVSALDDLITTVEAGSFVYIGWEPQALPAHRMIDVSDAYSGSLDAAKALHDALLPGWGWTISADGASVYGDDPKVYDVDNAHIPARAWLLAILKAYRETQP